MSLTLHTERLLLRPLEEGDRDMLIELLTAPAVMQFIRPPFLAEEVERMVPQMVKRGAHGAIGTWCVIEKATGERIGEAILLPLPIERDVTDWSKVIWDHYPEDDVELGYELLPRAWGKGYATELARRLLQFAFEQTELRDVVAVIDPENAASQRVLEKVGMQDAGVRRAYGGDCPSFRVTREQWRTQDHARPDGQ